MEDVKIFKTVDGKLFRSKEEAMIYEGKEKVPYSVIHAITNVVNAVRVIQNLPADGDFTVTIEVANKELIPAGYSTDKKFSTETIAAVRHFSMFNGLLWIHQVSNEINKELTFRVGPMAAELNEVLDGDVATYFDDVSAGKMAIS